MKTMLDSKRLLVNVTNLLRKPMHKYNVEFVTFKRS